MQALIRASSVAARHAAAPALGARALATTSSASIPAHLNTKRADFLVNFASPTRAREVYHYTSYSLAAGIPLALAIGAPVSTVVDAAMCVVLPLHGHLGMRSVIIDYVPEPSTQSMALMALAAFTGATALGLGAFCVNDVGITEGVKQLWVKQAEQ